MSKMKLKYKMRKKFVKSKKHIIVLLIISVLGVATYVLLPNSDPLKTEIITTDLDNFIEAFQSSQPDFDGEKLDELYFNKGSVGLNNFKKGRIKNSESFSKTLKHYKDYYQGALKSFTKISSKKNTIKQCLVKLKELYPKAIFPPIYFVVGNLSSGGTTFWNGLIIGADMYGKSKNTPEHKLGKWHKEKIKPVEEIVHIVSHEVIHFQQRYDGFDLLSACIKEGSADFIGELISGKHVNKKAHDYGELREVELWEEFKINMFSNDYSSWIYGSSNDGRPSDLGYWIGYKITKSYYDNFMDKKKAINDILNIKDFKKFL